MDCLLNFQILFIDAKEISNAPSVIKLIFLDLFISLKSSEETTTLLMPALLLILDVSEFLSQDEISFSILFMTFFMQFRQNVVLFKKCLNKKIKHI